MVVTTAIRHKIGLKYLIRTRERSLRERGIRHYPAAPTQKFASEKRVPCSTERGRFFEDCDCIENDARWTFARQVGCAPSQQCMK